MITCKKCGKELPENHQAQNIVPHENGTFEKRHFCSTCWNKQVEAQANQFLEIYKRTFGDA